MDARARAMTDLSEDETGELLSEILNHVVSLRLAMYEKIKTGFFLELNTMLDLRLHRLLIPAQVSEIPFENCWRRSLLLGDFSLAELGSRLSDFLGLGKGPDGSGGEFG